MRRTGQSERKRPKGRDGGALRRAAGGYRAGLFLEKYIVIFRTDEV
jgi:hypothetical protein